MKRGIKKFQKACVLKKKRAKSNKVIRHLRYYNLDDNLNFFR